MAYPVAVLYSSYSSKEHALNFATARPWEVVSAAKFSYGIKGQSMYIVLVNAVSGELHYIYHFAYGG